MRSGMAGTDNYLTEWRKGESYSFEANTDTLVQQEAERFETEYDQERIMKLVDNRGRA